VARETTAALGPSALPLCEPMIGKGLF
jgi:hypothetical protein